ncbi:MAG: 4-hydroxy-tetrahydrodipicolinate synthase [Myxococcales bacterium]|nr:MAG: 4-hydroxy-tetrahydrodipicolinate synthase [Myxococcales bacterium]
MFKGAITALITPMKDSGVDEGALRELVDWQIAEGIDALAPVGTTGEGATLTDAEHAKVIKTVVEQAKGRIPILAGAGTVSTHHTIELSRSAKEAGADGLLLVTPYYNRPSPEGLVAHYSAVLREVSLPTVLYNVPKRTGTNMSLEVIEQLLKFKDVVAVKEASGDVSQAQQMVMRFGDRIAVLCGDDALCLPFLSIGARGVVSVSSNVAPKAVKEVVEFHAAGQHEKALRRHQQLLALHHALFLESSPGPVKAMLADQGRVAAEIRLPLVMPSEATLAAVKRALKQVEEGKDV